MNYKNFYITIVAIVLLLVLLGGIIAYMDTSKTEASATESPTDKVLETASPAASYKSETFYIRILEDKRISSISSGEYMDDILQKRTANSEYIHVKIHYMRNGQFEMEARWLCQPVISNKGQIRVENVNTETFQSSIYLEGFCRGESSVFDLNHYLHYKNHFTVGDQKNHCLLLAEGGQGTVILDLDLNKGYCCPYYFQPAVESGKFKSHQVQWQQVVFSMSGTLNKPNQGLGFQFIL